MICNFIGLILELNCTFASYISNTFPQTSDFILKTYLVYNLIWTLILTIYVLYISIDTGILKKWNKPIPNWDKIQYQLAELYGERFTKYLEI